MQKTHDTENGKCIVGKVVGNNRDQRKAVESDEGDDGMCDKCCAAGRGNVDLC